MATFTNQARMTYNNTTTLSNVVTGELLGSLEATKTATADTYAIGDVLTYVVALRGTGATSLAGLTLTDDLGAYTAGGVTRYPLTYTDGSLLVYQNGTLITTPTVQATQPLTVTGIPVSAGGSTVIVYTATVNELAPPTVGGTITNTATVTGQGVGTAVSASETVTTADSPLLRIEKRIEPVPVEENGTLTYTLTILNYGNTAAIATDNVSVTDVFDPILTGLTVTYEGVTWTEGGEYTYDETTGTFVSTPGAITVPAATYTENPDGGYTTVPGTVTLVITGTV